MPTRTLTNPYHSVLNETLRLFPPVTIISKVSALDTAFTLTSPTTGEKRTLPVPAGMYISLCTPSPHHNPHYWPEPAAFRPARFLGDGPSGYNRDAFLPFGGGARACIGRGFAETEGVAVLTRIIAKYKVKMMDEPRFRGETFEQRKERVLAWGRSLTIL